MMNRSEVQAILDRFPRLKIALLGDLFLDRYLEIEPDVHEISIETGLEAYQITRIRNSPGALGTVMNNLAALGVGQLIPITVIGDDGHGFDLQRELAKLPVKMDYVFRDPNRLTPTYTKPIRRSPSGSVNELNRLDVRERRPLSDATQRQLEQLLAQAFEECDGLIVLDQIVEPDWGVVNSFVRNALPQLSRKWPEKLIFVDSRAHLAKFSCGVLKGNRSEILRAAKMTERSCEKDEDVLEAGNQLARQTGKPVYCTLSERGILVCSGRQAPTVVPGVRVEGEVDIVGAGDAATSGIVASLLSGANELQAAAIGNLVASITVQQIGTTGTATPAQIVERFGQTNYDKNNSAGYDTIPRTASA